MNDVRDTTMYSASGPVAELPPGWRAADDRPDVDMWALARRRRRLAIIAAVIGVLLLEAVGVIVWNAQSHYGRGQAALATGADALAAEEFSQATLLGLPYRDADTLEAQARASLTSDIEEREAQAARFEAVLTRLDRAAKALVSGDAERVLTASRAAGKAGLTDLAADSPQVAEATRDLVTDVAVAAREALADARWADAGRLAAAAILLDGAKEEWTTLTRRAEQGAELAAVVGKARAAADRRSWRTALQLAEQVLAERGDFPGAVQVAERARAALAAARARARAAAEAEAATQSSSGSGATAPAAGGSSGGTSTQPAPP